MSYKKGKDIKQQGDCLCYCYTRKIEVCFGMPLRIRGIESNTEALYYNYEDKPEGFEKW